MAERARIATLFAPLSASESGAFHLTDDAAVLTPPQGMALVITTDSVIESVHVLGDATPAQFAQKLVRRNLSDLAAMGAAPWRYSLNLHTPVGLAEDWFAAFAATLAREQTHFDMVLVGGDSTSGGALIHTGMTCYGLLAHAPLRRNGAHIGDDLYVSGSIGDAALALRLLQHHQPIDDALAARYHAPTPRLELGKMLHGHATAAIDISDGLLADIGQLCAASHCGADIDYAVLPLSQHLANAALDAASVAALALSGGDDYELCFTAPVSARSAIAGIATQLALPLTRIGCITAGGIRVLDASGAAMAVQRTGWEHR
jgi:thiamine-monophosphate kinase